MASSVYTTAFIKTQGGSIGAFTCPAGYRAVVRFVTAFNGSAIAREQAQLVHSPSGQTFYYEQLDPTLLPAEAGYFSTEMRYVFDEGETISTLNGGDIDMSVSGYLLKLP